MICPECKTLNPNSIKKCIKCGAKLEKSAAPKKKPEKRTSIKPQKQAAPKPAKVQKQKPTGGGEEKKKGKGMLIIILLILAAVGAYFTKPDFASFKDFLASGIETNQEDIFYQLLAKDEFISKGLVDSLEYQDLYVCAMVEIKTKMSSRKFLGVATSWYDISQPAAIDSSAIAEVDTVSLDKDDKKKRNKVYDEYNDIYLGKKSKGPQDTTLYKSLSDAEAAQRNKKKRKANEKIYYAKDNKKMVLVPAQSFKMGSDKGSFIEKPSHKVKVRSFYMDATEVTNVQFKRFLKESGYKPKGTLEHLKDRRFNHDSQPIVDVDYYDAAAYAKWAGKRLPTEREWECAARGGKGYKYASGDSVMTSDKARYGMPITTGSTIRVGSYQANKYGISDLAGNAAEWVSGVLTAYPGNEEMFSGYGKNRIGRGGSWFSDESETTSFSRKLLNISNSTGNIGFRCAIGHDMVMKLENH